MKTCSINNCNNEAIKRGWCHNHYERWRRNGDPTISGWDLRRKEHEEDPEPTEKKCKKCGEVKPLEQFYRRLTPTIWYYAKCKTCLNKERAAKKLQDRLDNPRPPRKKVDHGLCAFDGCEHKAKTRLKGGPEGWYCVPHWTHWSQRKALRPLRKMNQSYINEDFRRCTACNTVKPQEDFYERTNGAGHQSNCRACLYMVTRVNALLRENRAIEALRLAETMPERIRGKYVGRCLDAIKTSDFERSNESGGRGEEQ